MIFYLWEAQRASHFTAEWINNGIENSCFQNGKLKFKKKIDWGHTHFMDWDLFGPWQILQQWCFWDRRNYMLDVCHKKGDIWDGAYNSSNPNDSTAKLSSAWSWRSTIRKMLDMALIVSGCLKTWGCLDPAISLFFRPGTVGAGSFNHLVIDQAPEKLSCIWDFRSFRALLS